MRELTGASFLRLDWSDRMSSFRDIYFHDDISLFGQFPQKMETRTVIMRSLNLRNCSRKFDADAAMEYFWSDEFWLVWIDDYRVRV